MSEVGTVIFSGQFKSCVGRIQTVCEVEFRLSAGVDDPGVKIETTREFLVDAWDHDGDPVFPNQGLLAMSLANPGFRKWALETARRALAAR